MGVGSAGCPRASSACPGRSSFIFCDLASHSLSVLSLLADTIMRLSELHATMYTGPTCARRDEMNWPVRPFQSFTLLSKEPDATCGAREGDSGRRGKHGRE